MAYDLEKYRDKREKVLGVKKRSMSFGTIATIVTSVIILGLSVFIVPKSIAYFASRNLDDAIFKLQVNEEWSETVIAEISKIKGVKTAITDNDSKRLVITFDRMKMELTDILSVFKSRGINAVLLNRVNHIQRKSTLKEEAEFEAL